MDNVISRFWEQLAVRTCMGCGKEGLDKKGYIPYDWVDFPHPSTETDKITTISMCPSCIKGGKISTRILKKKLKIPVLQKESVIRIRCAGCDEEELWHESDGKPFTQFPGWVKVDAGRKSVAFCSNACLKKLHKLIEKWDEDARGD